MLVKMNDIDYGVTLNDEFKTLVNSLDSVGIDTKPEIEAWFDHLDSGNQEYVNELITDQLHLLYGDINNDSLWDLFLGLFS